MAGRALSRRKCHYKAADGLLMVDGIRGYRQEEKSREWPLKWQGWREAKKQTKTQAARAFGSRRFFVILYNGKTAQ